MRARVSSFLRTLFGRKQASEELDDEFQFHIEARADDLEREGLTRAQALRQARVEFGGASFYREEARASHGVRLADGLFQDARQAVRLWSRSPAFALSVGGILALGIGAATAAFSVVDTVLFQPPSFRAPEELVRITGEGSRGGSFRWAEHELLAERTDLFQASAAYSWDMVTVTGADPAVDPAQEPPDQVWSARVSPGLFEVLGVGVGLGATLEAQGGDAVVISHRLWHRRYRGSSDVLGRRLTLSGEPYRIVGITPHEFEFPVPNVDLWMPLRPEQDARVNAKVVARLRQGVTLEQTQQALVVVEQRIRELDPERNAELRLKTNLWQDRVDEPYERTMALVLAGVGCLLLIACANVSGLLLGRTARRRREIAIRSSLGAGRWRTARGLLAESLLLTSAGSLAGVSFAHLLLRWLTGGLSSLPIILPRIQHLELDGRSLVAAVAVCLVTGTLASIAPILFAGRTPARAALASGDRAGRKGAGRLFSLLAGSQAAFAFLLLVGSGLMLQSLLRLVESDKGFQTENIVTMRTPVGTARSPRPEARTQEQLAAHYQALLEGVERVPGVESAAYVSNLPLSGLRTTLIFPGEDGARWGASVRSISPAYLDVMRIPLLSGRGFDESDREGAPRVAIINEFLARELFGTEDAVGRVVPWNREQSIRVVGVAKNSWQYRFDRPIIAEMYVPYRQSLRFEFVSTFVLRTSRPTAEIADELRAAVWSFDPEQPIVKIETMDEVLWSAIWRPRFAAWLFTALGALALLLSACGVYAVVAFTTAMRMREAGIRMAVGARPADVVRLVLADALRPLAVGLAAGALAAYLLSGFLSAVLYETQGVDPTAYLGAGGVLLTVGAGAGLGPALRAAGSDPLEVLRAD